MGSRVAPASGRTPARKRATAGGGNGPSPSPSASTSGSLVDDLKFKTAKTKAGSRALTNKGAKLEENEKRLLLLRGRKASEVVQKALVDVARLKGLAVVRHQRNNDVTPFETGGEEPLQHMCSKADTSCFVLGAHSKKRPHSLTLGRTYDFQLLDMVEVGIKRYEGMDAFRAKGVPSYQTGNKPCFTFAGEDFETRPEYAALKSILLDAFRGMEVPSVNLKGLDRVISVTAAEDVVYLRQYVIAMKKSGTKIPRVELSECGPRFDFEMRRFRRAPDALMKEALQKPKLTGAAKIKNAKMDSLLGKVGRIYMPGQDVEALPAHKMKGVKRARREGAAERKKARQDAPETG